MSRGRGVSPRNQARGRGRGILTRAMPESHNATFSYAEARIFGEDNYNFCKSSTKGLVLPAHPAFRWIDSVFRQRGISYGELVELARLGENCYLASLHPQGYVLWDVAHELVPVDGFRKGAEYALLWSPVNLVRNSNHSEILHPDPDVHLRGNLLHFPQLYGRQWCRIQLANSPDCKCVSPFAQVTNPAIFSPICLKDGLILAEEWDFPVHSSFDKEFSLSRVYLNSNSGNYEKRYSLLCPQPHPLAVRWSNRVAVPAYHGRSLKPGDRWILAIADPRYRLETSRWFQAEPAHWTVDAHPYLSEPMEGTELFSLSQAGYGCETIPRLHFGGLGAAHSFWVSTSAISNELVAEEFAMDGPHTHESFLLTMREDFLAGKARISCPSCPPRFSSHGRYTILRYNRREYLCHYREEHRPDMGFLGVETGTGMNQRLTESLYLYLFALAREAMCPDSDFGLRSFSKERVTPFFRGAQAFTSSVGRASTAPAMSGSAQAGPSGAGTRSTPVPNPAPPARAGPTPSVSAPPLSVAQPAPPVAPAQGAAPAASLFRPAQGSTPAASPAKQAQAVTASAPSAQPSPAAASAAQAAPTASTAHTAPRGGAAAPEAMDTSQSSPDPSGLNALTLGAEAPGAEAAPLPRRETSRSRKAPGEKPEKG
jgi:hypothetical protein